jgi:hypothetical protein
VDHLVEADLLAVADARDGVRVGVHRHHIAWIVD